MFNSIPDESWVSSVLRNVVLNLGGNWTLLTPKNRWVEVNMFMFLAKCFAYLLRFLIKSNLSFYEFRKVEKQRYEDDGGLRGKYDF